MVYHYYGRFVYFLLSDFKYREFGNLRLYDFNTSYSLKDFILKSSYYTFMCSDFSKYRVFWGITIVLKTTLSNKCV